MWVKRICDDYGLNENQLATKSGINRSSLNVTKKSKNRNSIKHTKAENVKKISKTLGCSMDELYDWYK